MVSPFAPHLGEECWKFLGNREVSYARWVHWDEELCASEVVTLGVQVGELGALVLVDYRVTISQSFSRSSPLPLRQFSGQCHWLGELLDHFTGQISGQFSLSFLVKIISHLILPQFYSLFSPGMDVRTGSSSLLVYN